jgi:hypothetical protein
VVGVTVLITLILADKLRGLPGVNKLPTL